MKVEGARIGAGFEEQIEDRKRLKGGVVAGAIGHGAVGCFEHLFEEWPIGLAEGLGHLTKLAAERERALEATADGEEVPAGAPMDVFAL